MESVGIFQLIGATPSRLPQIQRANLGEGKMRGLPPSKITRDISPNKDRCVSPQNQGRFRNDS